MNNITHNKKLLMLAGVYVEDYEIKVPFQVFGMLGDQFDDACPVKKAGDKVLTVIHDFEEMRTYSEKLGHGFTFNAEFDFINTEAYLGLIELILG